MILFILAILTILMFGFWILIKHPILRYVLSFITATLFCLAILMLSLNMKAHWGMEQKTTTSQPVTIYSAGPKNAPMNFLIIKQVGKTDNYVMIFKEDKNDKEAQPHFVPDKDNLVEAVKQRAVYQRKNVAKATYVVKTTRWDYQSDLFRMLFKLGDGKDRLIEQKTIVTIPKQGWLVLTEKQAKQQLVALNNQGMSY